MRPNDVLTRLQASPFLPFRIRHDNGRIIEIRHPNSLRVGKSTVAVFSFAGEPADPYEEVEVISLVLIDAIEPLEERTRIVDF